MIEKLIAGFVFLFFSGIGGVTAYRLMGVPFHITLIFVTLYWSGTLLITYYGTGWIVKKIKKWESVNIFINSSKKWWEKKIRVLSKRKRFREKAVLWLTEQKEWVVLLLTFIPYVPELPTITIIAARLMKIKYALFFLLLGNFFRTFILVATVYQFLPSL